MWGLLESARRPNRAMKIKSKSQSKDKILVAVVLDTAIYYNIKDNMYEENLLIIIHVLQLRLIDSDILLYVYTVIIPFN